MIRPNHKRPLLDVLLVVGAAWVIVLRPPQAYAQDMTRRLIDVLRANGAITADQYNALSRSAAGSGGGADATTLQLIEVLHGNGTLSDAAYRELVHAPASRSGGAPSVSTVPVEGKGAGAEEIRAASTEQAPITAPPGQRAAPETPPASKNAGVDIDVGSGGLVIESKDGASSFALGGRVHVDAAWFNNDGDVKSGDATEVRRARIELDGKFHRVWEYGAAVDFGDGDVSLKSTYVSYVGFKQLTLTAGNWKEPFSLEELESSNYMTFMERASVNALVPGRNVGIGAEAYGTHWTFGGGAFGEGADDENEDGVNGSYGIVARATYAPWVEKTRVLHFGTATEYRTYDTSADVRFDSRWDTHLADGPLVDTGNITGVEDIVRVGAEAAGVLGPFTAQTEWIGARLNREDGAPTAWLDGWYVYGGWTLTGESRIYKSKSGRFAGIDPAHPVGEGGWGAWQLGLRYDVLDLNDEDINGGRQDLLTAGLNWYAMRNVRFMWNWVKILDLDRPGTPENGNKSSVFEVRTQVNW